MEFWPLHYTQINIRDSKTVSILSHSPMDHLSTSPSSQWISIALERHQTLLRWGMVIQRTLRWWEGSVEMAAMSPTPCKPLNTTWGSGERWSNRRGIQFHNCLLLAFRFFSNYFGSGQGFQLKYHELNGTPLTTYRIGACGGSFTTSKGILTSPSYPLNYPNDADCIYTVSQPNGTYVSISFLTIDIDCSDTQPIQPVHPIQGRLLCIVGWWMFSGIQVTYQLNCHFEPLNKRPIFDQSQYWSIRIQTSYMKSG